MASRSRAIGLGVAFVAGLAVMLALLVDRSGSSTPADSVAASMDSPTPSSPSASTSTGKSTPEETAVDAAQLPRDAWIPMTGPAPAILQARCDATVLDLVDGEVPLDRLEPLDADAAAALEFAERQGGVSEYVRSDYDWRVTESTPEEIVLLGVPVDRSSDLFASAFLLRDAAGTFRTLVPGIGALGYCNMEIVADGFTAATLTPDPGAPIQPGATTLRLLAHEDACAIAKPPSRDGVYARVTETDGAVSVLVLVPVDARMPDQTCQSTRLFPIEITLDAPLGTRTLDDARFLPTVPIR